MLPGSQVSVVSKMVEQRELHGVPEGLRAYARAELRGDGGAVVRMLAEHEEKAAARRAARGRGLLREFVAALESAFASPGWG